ncbi:MAG: extracellular solute-binding protein [Desulfobacterales bacterium]|nr:extracellular solute-binding protein [Desulfobacterales bacterium]
MRAKKSAILCIILSVLFVLTVVLPETARAGLRDDMIAQAKQEGEFVLAGSNADKMRDELTDFKKLYPFITIKAFVANTGDTVNRVTAEARAGKASVDLPAISNDGLELLNKQGLFKKFEFPHLKDIPADTQPSHGNFLQLFMNPRTQGVYNTTLVKPEEVPRSWDDMVHPRWKGRTMISRSSEDFPAQLAWLWKKDGKLAWERSFEFWRKIEQQKPLVAMGYRGGIKQVAAGEAAVFWFAAVGPAGRMAGVGAPLALVAFPKFTATYRSFGILKDARHPASAWLLIDYLSSPEGHLEYLNKISAKVGTNRKAKVGKLAKWLVKQNATVENSVPLDVEILFDKEINKKSEDFFFKLIGIK